MVFRRGRYRSHRVCRSARFSRIFDGFIEWEKLLRSVSRARCVCGISLSSAEAFGDPACVSVSVVAVFSVCPAFSNSASKARLLSSGSIVRIRLTSSFLCRCTASRISDVSVPLLGISVFWLSRKSIASRKRIFGRICERMSGRRCVVTLRRACLSKGRNPRNSRISARCR